MYTDVVSYMARHHSVGVALATQVRFVFIILLIMMAFTTEAFTTETTNNVECQYQYPWSDKDQKIIQEYKTWLDDEWWRVNTLESSGPTGGHWPKKPKVDARTLDSGAKMKREILSGQRLHEYLMQNIVSDVFNLNLQMNPLTGASPSLVSLQARLSEVWKNIQKAQREMVGWYIDYENALNIAFSIHKLESDVDHRIETWEVWLKENVGISSSQGRKLRAIAKLLGPYPRFRKLGISFDELYRRRNHIQVMLESGNPLWVTFWQQP